jgi:hypothetical protein
MALFGSDRDMSLFRRVNREIINRIIDTEVLLYKLNLERTDTNLYGESDRKTYYQPTRMHCLIMRDSRTSSGDDYGIDTQRTATFAFFKPDLIEKNIIVQVGDILHWDGEYYELDNQNNAQDYIAGKEENTDLGVTTGERGIFGMDISVIFEGHATRMNSINIEPVRTGINKINYKPRNL